MKNNEIDLIGSEISYLYIHIGAIREIIKQSNVNFEVYKQYFNFFYHSYEAFHNELIHRICRLTDKDYSTTSLRNLLTNRSKPDEDKKETYLDILKRITKHDTLKKIHLIRHNFLAHKNKNLSREQNIVNNFYKKNEFDLSEIEQYIRLLVQAWEVCSGIAFQRPHMEIRSQIRSLYFHTICRG